MWTRSPVTPVSWPSVLPLVTFATVNILSILTVAIGARWKGLFYNDVGVVGRGEDGI